MLKKVIILAVMAVFMGLTCMTGALIAADVPDEISIHEKAFKKYKKGPVKLDHKKHSTEYKVACTECHHVYKDGKNVWKEGDEVQKCSACHDVKKKKDGAMKLKNAFHKNCKTCHKKLGKGPEKKCADCHAKK